MCLHMFIGELQFAIVLVAREVSTPTLLSVCSTYSMCMCGCVCGCVYVCGCAVVWVWIKANKNGRLMGLVS